MQSCKAQLMRLSTRSLRISSSRWTAKSWRFRWQAKECATWSSARPSCRARCRCVQRCALQALGLCCSLHNSVKIDPFCVGELSSSCSSCSSGRCANCHQRLQARAQWHAPPPNPQLPKPICAALQQPTANINARSPPTQTSHICISVHATVCANLPTTSRIAGG